MHVLKLLKVMIVNLGNDLTRTLCKQAFEILYDAIMNDKPENYPYGSMLSGMGFGNCSTTLRTCIVLCVLK